MYAVGVKCRCYFQYKNDDRVMCKKIYKTCIFRGSILFVAYLAVLYHVYAELNVQPFLWHNW